MRKIIWVDSSEYSHVAKCPCGWRDLYLTADEAYRALAKHEAAWHPDRRTARIACHQYTTRRRDQRSPRNTRPDMAKHK